ncbi:restriction endonuclease [Streptomyces muensis]|uniref:Restriction endonuclease n=1 Tax=Streptomyces muensis TaxID=1077944 RepID=A0A9X1Q5N1_STRM4|nr:restriction endonuclease [Streptomyces muensis]MCF1597711.1 restriction endonuclease [Streptomyces muensis]
MASTTRRPHPERRRPARRTSRRRHPAGRRRGAVRRGWRRHLTAGDRTALIIVVVLALLFIGDYLSRHPGILAALLTVLGLAGVTTAYLWGRRRYRRWRLDGHGELPTDIDHFRALSPGGFERAVARLCQRDGCTKVEVLGGANDRAGDVKARTPDGRWLLIQCKRYTQTKKVSAEVLYQVNGTYQDTHGCDLAAIVTTSGFTASAFDWNNDLEAPLKLMGSQALLEWADGTGRAPWQ